MPDMTRSRFSIPWVCGALAIFVCMMWGMDFVLIKLGYSQFSIASSDTGSILMFAGTRFILSGIMTLAVLSAVKRKLMLLRKSNVVNACMLALFQTVGQYVLLYLGMARTSAVHASIFDSTLVFFSILISGFVFHQEKLSVNKIFGCVLGFFGIVVMNIGGSPEKSALLGDVLVPGNEMRPSAPGAILTLIALALISSVTGALWNALLKHNPVSSVNIYFFANPVFGVIFSALILGETGQILRIQSIMALVLICAGILMINFRSRKKN